MYFQHIPNFLLQSPQIKALLTTRYYRVEVHIRTLQNLCSTTIGGPTGLICPRDGVSSHDEPDKVWPLVSSPDAEFVFCHVNLSQQNIFVDEDTLKITCIKDWEHAGYYPSYFEAPYYQSSKNSGSQSWVLPNNSMMNTFFEKSGNKPAITKATSKL